MTEQSLPPTPSREREGESRCGLVAVLGAPNAGKSTLVNALVGQKVAIVSPKAQTTRARLMGIAIEREAQLLLVDTPGIFAPHRRLDRAMVKAAWEGAEDADRIVLVIDAAAKVGARVEDMLQGVENRPEPKILVLNKVDIAKKEDLLILAAKLAERLKPETIFMVSATTGDGVPDLKRHLAGAMPESAWHFPDDQLSDVTDRMVAAELTREQLYHQLHAELPYSSAIATEKWEDRKDGSTVIHQQILIERDSQKAIILGKGGSRLKAIGQAAREEIAEHLGRKVHLFLHVKVNPRWDEDRSLYQDIGLDWAD
jgi:GTPase